MRARALLDFAHRLRLGRISTARSLRMPIARVALALLAAAASLCALAQPLPTFPAKNVAETFFGTVVDDPYRALENVKDPAVVAWVKAHADHAQRTLASIPRYAKMRSRGAPRE